MIGVVNRQQKDFFERQFVLFHLGKKPLFGLFRAVKRLFVDLAVDDERVRIVLAEAGGHGVDSGYTAATIHAGRLGILHGSKTLVMQTPDGQIMEAGTISAGLDYPGIGPMHAHLATEHRATVLAINDDEAIRAGYELTRMEGIIPAIESAHAVAALAKVNFKPTDVVVLTVSGRGDKDVETYLSNKQMAGEYGNF